MPSDQQKVSDHYNRDPAKEWRRLTEPRSRIEFASTLHLIERYFPPIGHVGDIAGGPGRYTLELLKRGYRATLVDRAESFSVKTCELPQFRDGSDHLHLVVRRA